MGAKKNFRKHFSHHSEMVQTDEAVRRLSSALGPSFSTAECMELLANGAGDVPPPHGFLSEPKKWQTDDLSNWLDKYRDKLWSQKRASGVR
jgi:hypothetical protein